MTRSLKVYLVALAVAYPSTTPVMAQSTSGAGQEAAPSNERIKIDKSQLPVAQLVPKWALVVARIVIERERIGEDASPLLGQYGLEPESPAVRMLLDIHDRYWERFPASELARRYEESTAPEEVVMRRWNMEKARFQGREMGAWFAALESEGVDTAALVRTIRTTPYYSGGRTIEPDDLVLQRIERESVAFHEEFRKTFGGPFPTEEVPR